MYLKVFFKKKQLNQMLKFACLKYKNILVTIVGNPWTIDDDCTFFFFFNQNVLLHQNSKKQNNYYMIYL
jgi:hypothetical protein